MKYNIINTTSWVKDTAKFPIAFAQVREDPLLDETAINLIRKENAKVLMIASGGCTAAYLATKNNIHSIDLVDANLAQLALTNYKLHLLGSYDTSERLQLLGHSTAPLDMRRKIFEDWCKSNNYINTIFGNPETVQQYGPDYIGRYEILFLKLQEELFEYQESLHYILSNRNQTATDKLDKLSDVLKNAFKKIMSLENLVALFGPDATQNPALPFWEHFYHQTHNALHHKKANNPFLASVLLGHSINDTYAPWFTTPKQKINTRINYHQKLMGEMLSTSNETYDFIHLSNILDWLNEEQGATILRQAKNRLNSGGILIIRQLNSNLKIDQLNSELQWLKSESTELLQQDRSFFYRNIYLGRCP